jgi:hypothetical protein
LPKVNILGSTKRHGRSAAYGEGFLLTELSPGTHVVRGRGSVQGRTVTLTYRIKVEQ